VVEYPYMDERQRFSDHFFIAAAIVVASYIIIYGVIGQGPLSHCVYDSYTRQAAAWWQGRLSLPENVTWLELATYRGEYFVSFPPFPSVVQFLLYPVFGMNTPDNLVNSLFGLGSFVLVYRFLYRRGYGGLSASVFALLMTLGTNLFYISATGWVWFSAQTQAFFFSVLAVYLIYSEKKTAWYFSFLSLGIAFACRPFQVVYAPLMVYLLYYNFGNEKGFLRTLLGCVKYALPFLFVGGLVAAYNYARFGDIFEFGHNYLPEFMESEQFSFLYVPGNFMEILKLPGSEELFWPRFNGTLFFLVNPVFVALAISLFRGFGERESVYFLCFIVHFVLLLTHRTMGGWQFGCRYLVDLIPFMLVVFEGDGAYKKSAAGREAVLPISLAAAGIAINIWGAVWYYTQPMI
jgi:4-amino-4-deoxy-L-arabinose transferase-like glycosyltransferase